MSIADAVPEPGEPWTTADPERVQHGTAKGPGQRPGARKPGRKRREKQPHEIIRYTPEEKRAVIQRRIAKETAKADFVSRAVALRRLNHEWVEIAQIMSVERNEPVTAARVRRNVLNALRNVEGLDDLRYRELDILESLAGNLRRKLDELDALPGVALDLEVYAKVADTYLKYRERIAKLCGLDAPVRQHVSRDSGAVDPGLGGSVHIGPDGVTVHMPGSIAAYEDWRQLAAAGVVDVVDQVLELEAGDHEEVAIGLHDAKAGLTLRPDAEVVPLAERRVTSALDALDLIASPEQQA